MIYFTSDLHFSHKNILNMGHGRPFSSTEEMNQKLIENWNKKVTSNEDMVYVLGDVFWGQNSDQIISIPGYYFLLSFVVSENLPFPSLFLQVAPG